VTIDVAAARAQIPALQRRVDGRGAIYLDGPGGTQTPESVVEAMSSVLRAGISNHDGPFVTSRIADDLADNARLAVADLIAGRPGEVSFGQNMTSLTLAFSRALGRTWGPGDEIVVSRLDHDANISPWLIAADRAGATIRFADFDPDDGCRLRADHIAEVLSDRTRLVAFTHASNAFGTVVDAREITALAHEVGATVFVDAVHLAPHWPIDVGAIGCDILVASAYKFFGPHTGIMWGRSDLLESIDAVKIRPAPGTGPDKWETGTPSYESLAGVTAAVDHLARLGEGPDRRAAMGPAMEAVRAYEGSLSRRFIDGIAGIDGVDLYGVKDGPDRTPTFAVSIDGITPQRASELLGEQGIFTWAGHYYAIEPIGRLGLMESGGLLRIGMVHHTTTDEVDVAVEALDRLAAGASLAGLPDPNG